MDADDEIQPSSPRPNGRITVTVASASPPPAAQTGDSFTLALPIQNPPPRSGGGGGGGREDCWSEGATAALIEAWGERYLDLSRGNLRQSHWTEVADAVNGRGDRTKTPKTDVQCKNRIDTLKKKYKSEKAKLSAGAGPSKWPFYDRLHHLIGPTVKPSPAAAAAAPHRRQSLPVGIPVQIRPISQIRLSRPIDSDSSPENSPVKRPKILNPKAKDVGGDSDSDSITELSRAILQFGEAYEQVEMSKLKQAVEMEKQRMKFTKDLELQRMQFFMKTQLELSKLKHGRKAKNNSDRQ